MEEEFTDQSARRGVQSVDVGGKLLNALCEYRYPMRLKELAEASDMPSAKAHRYVTSLVRIGLASQDERTGLYSIGPMALRLGLIAIERNDIVGKAGVLLRKICVDLRTSGHMAIWGERGPVLIRNEHGGPPVISTMGVGAIMPLIRTATGQIFLSYLNRESTRAIVDTELASSEFLQRDVERIVSETQERGFSIVAGKFVPGLFAVAFPIFNIDGTIACSVSAITTNPELFGENTPAIQLMMSSVTGMNRDWGSVVNLPAGGGTDT